ncbi:MAG TPA: restriction endonuclease subunit S [Bacteroidia bacterium]|nr:restriction endonuclease subunit S [Bacteroidia bacterium]
MDFVKLTDVCDFQGGTQPPKKEWKKELTKGYVRMLQIRDFTQRERNNVEYVFDKPTLKKCTKEDVLIGRYGASIGKICTGLEGAYNVALIKTIPDKTKLDRNFLLYILKGSEFQHFISNIGSRAAQAGFNKTDLQGFDIPLPPLPVQQKIAAILDAADELRQKDKALVAKYDELTQALFLDMFGDPVSNPKGWEKSETINFCSSIVPGRDKPKSFTGNIPWVTTADLNHLGFTTKSKSDIGLTDKEIAEVRAKIIPKGSVIMTCVGELGIITINETGMVVNQQLHAFVCSDRINNIFLMHSLSYQKSYMNKMASSTTVPYMNKTVSNNVPTICPPINLQNQFAERVKVIEEQKNIAQASALKSEELFNSLLQKAFNGELV